MDFGKSNHSVCFYPAAGFDGSPVRIPGSTIQHFVYADYCKTREQLLAAARGQDSNNLMFEGYEVVSDRPVTQAELCPAGWPKIPRKTREKREQHHSRSYVKPWFAHELQFRRLPRSGDTRGPDEFSLLYIGDDGVRVYEALFLRRGLVPDCIAIIDPGTGWGDNWTSFGDRNAELGKTVAKGPHLPKLYLTNLSLPWPEYSVARGTVGYHNGTDLTLWSLP